MKKKNTTSLKINLCTSEKSNDSEDEKVQLKTLHQANPSAMEQTMNNSSFDPSFYKQKAHFS